jgi:hypothetical protein
MQPMESAEDANDQRHSPLQHDIAQSDIPHYTNSTAWPEAIPLPSYLSEQADPVQVQRWAEEEGETMVFSRRTLCCFSS